MEQEHKSVREMWENYLTYIDDDISTTDKKYISWHFCDNEKDANELADLVKKGIKRATTGLYFYYEVENEPIPKAGDLNIIIDWQGKAKCIIETKNVEIIPFNEVTEEYSRTEGEGDKSLKYWQDVHISAFSRGLKKHNREFNKDMLVVCEEFEVIYK